MDLRDKLHLIVYRVRERGLEIFVRERDADALELPEGYLDADGELLKSLQGEPIELDDRSIAIEGDYHDIPSLKGLLRDDARRLRDQLLDLPSAEEGTFVLLSKAAKRLLPGQYAKLKELRDIIVDRNSTKYM